MTITGEQVIFAVAMASTIVGMWNAWQHALISKVLAELQLNLRREFNGRYVSITTLDDVRYRITRLEAHDDKEKR